MFQTKFILALALLCGVCAFIFLPISQTSTAGQNREMNNAPEIARAVAALGGAERLRDVRTLSMSGTHRRAVSGQERSGTFELYFMSPDRLKKIETSQVEQVRFSVTQALNQDDTWSRTDVTMNGAKVKVSDPPDSIHTRRLYKAQFTPHLLPFLLANPELNSMVFSQEKPLVFAFRAPDGIEGRVVLDEKTYLPVTMTYRGRPMLIIGDDSGVETHPPPTDAELQVYFSDYRAQDGILLPHLMRVELNGKFVEQFELQTCRINPEDVTATSFARR